MLGGRQRSRASVREPPYRSTPEQLLLIDEVMYGDECVD